MDCDDNMDRLDKISSFRSFVKVNLVKGRFLLLFVIVLFMFEYFVAVTVAAVVDDIDGFWFEWMLLLLLLFDKGVTM